MKVVFMGTPDFAVPVLEALADSRHEILAVVTQPDKPKGRSGKLIPPPVKEAALARNIPVLQPARVKDSAFVAELAGLAPDVVVVAAFGQILSRELLELPKYGCMCVHASLLPKLRGAAPIQWSVINGDEESGVTIMQMDEGIDTGDILLVERCRLDRKETGGSLFEKLSLLGGPLVLEALDRAEQGTLEPVPQEHEKHTYAKMLDKSLGEIDFTKSAVEIERLIRGLNPWPSAYTYINGKLLKIWEADAVQAGTDMYGGEKPARDKGAGSSELKAAETEAVPSASRAQKDEPVPGTVVAVEKDYFAVQTGNGVLQINSLQLEGKKRMDTEAFLRGYPLDRGICLGKS